MWIIEKEHDERGDWPTLSKVVRKVKVLSRTYKADRDNTCTVKFRLYDDDGILYYEGRMNDWEWENNPFGPLDDYGMPNSGCTELRYKKEGKWETL